MTGPTVKSRPTAANLSRVAKGIAWVLAEIAVLVGIASAFVCLGYLRYHPLRVTDPWYALSFPSQVLLVMYGLGTIDLIWLRWGRREGEPLPLGLALLFALGDSIRELLRDWWPGRRARRR